MLIINGINIISVMFPVIRTLDVHGPRLPLKNSKLNLFWRHTLQTYTSFCCKVSPAKPEELVTELLFYNDNIQVGNNTILYRRWIKKGVCRISHLLHKHGDFLCLGEFNTKYGLNTDFVTYSGCVQAVKKYIKGLGIALQSNKSLSIRKSLTIIGKVQKGTERIMTFQLKIKGNRSVALNGTAYCLTILIGLKHFTK